LSDTYKTAKTRQHRKALWHNVCPSHNLLRLLTLTHDLDNKRGERMQEW